MIRLASYCANPQLSYERDADRGKYWSYGSGGINLSRPAELRRWVPETLGRNGLS
jgi:hypothetical protein